MDSLTHLVAGALTPIAFRGTPKRAALIAFGIAAGELPDMDILFGSSPEALMTLHRGITHALFWQPVMALLVVIPAYLWLCNRPAGRAGAGPFCRDPALPEGTMGRYQKTGAFDNGGAPSFGLLWLAALFALCTHIYLDCMTTFGTQVLLPFSGLRAGLPAMFIVDLLLTVPAACLLILALRRPPEYAATGGSPHRPLPAAGASPGAAAAFYSGRARLLARAGLAWVLIYPLLALGVNHAAAALLAPDVRDRAGASAQAGVRLITEPFSPFVWKTVVEDGDRWTLGTVSLLRPQRGHGQSAHQKPDAMLYDSLARQAPIFVYFKDFAPLMTQEERPVPALTQAGYKERIRELRFADLRYIAAPDSFLRMVGRGDALFALEARVNESGALLAYRFLRREAERDTPWVLLE